MAIADTEISHVSLADSRFKIAAFICFFEAILYVPMIIIRIVATSKVSAGLMFSIQIPQTILSFVFSIYIILQLKRLLVERHHLQNMSILIKFLLIGCSYSFATGIFVSIFTIFARDPTVNTILSGIFVISMFLLAGIIIFIFGLRLRHLKTNDQTSGLYRTLAIMEIIRGICLFTIILVPIGILLSVAVLIVLGRIFLKESETESEVEFV